MQRRRVVPTGYICDELQDEGALHARNPDKDVCGHNFVLDSCFIECIAWLFAILELEKFLALS
jgi:hypothetical protein